MLPKTIFLTEKLNFDSKPSFSDWKITTAQGLIHGDLSINGEKLKLKFRLWDGFSEKQMVAQQLTTEVIIGGELPMLFQILFKKNYWRVRLF